MTKGASWGLVWGFFFGLLFFIPVLEIGVGAGLGALMGKFAKTSIDGARVLGEERGLHSRQWMSVDPAPVVHPSEPPLQGGDPAEGMRWRFSRAVAAHLTGREVRLPPIVGCACPFG